MFTPEDFALAGRAVYAVMKPTLANPWPLLREAAGCEVWVKHENHTPTGAFKVRGGLNYLARLHDSGKAMPAGLISATRGNHGQSIPSAAARYGLPVTIVVPHGNSGEKNAAMRALGAELIEHGETFDEAKAYAIEQAEARNLHMVPAYHPWLVAGVATYPQRSCQQRGPQGTFSPQEHHLDCNPLPTEQQERSTFPTSWTLQQPARGRGRSIHSGILPVPTVRMSVNCNLSSDSSTLASQKSNTNP